MYIADSFILWYMYIRRLTKLKLNCKIESSKEIYLDPELELDSLIRVLGNFTAN